MTAKRIEVRGADHEWVGPYCDISHSLDPGTLLRHYGRLHSPPKLFDSWGKDIRHFWTAQGWENVGQYFARDLTIALGETNVRVIERTFIPIFTDETHYIAKAEDIK